MRIAIKPFPNMSKGFILQKIWASNIAFSCRVRQISKICLFAGFMQSDAPYQYASCVSPVKVPHLNIQKVYGTKVIGFRFVVDS